MCLFPHSTALHSESCILHLLRIPASLSHRKSHPTGKHMTLIIKIFAFGGLCCVWGLAVFLELHAFSPHPLTQTFSGLSAFFSAPGLPRSCLYLSALLSVFSYCPPLACCPCIPWLQLVTRFPTITPLFPWLRCSLLAVSLVKHCLHCHATPCPCSLISTIWISLFIILS